MHLQETCVASMRATWRIRCTVLWSSSTLVGGVRWSVEPPEGSTQDREKHTLTHTHIHAHIPRQGMASTGKLCESRCVYVCVNVCIELWVAKDEV
jgi:hypothetical protein